MQYFFAYAIIYSFDKKENTSGVEYGERILPDRIVREQAEDEGGYIDET